MTVPSSIPFTSDIQHVKALVLPFFNLRKRTFTEIIKQAVKYETGSVQEPTMPEDKKKALLSLKNRCDFTSNAHKVIY